MRCTDSLRNDRTRKSPEKPGLSFFPASSCNVLKQHQSFFINTFDRRCRL
jgi:hypothetical protein